MSRSDPKPRILLVTRNLAPLVGGMERLLQNLALGVAKYADLTVVGPNGCKQYLPESIEVYEASEKLLPFLFRSTWLSIKASRKQHYDLVIGGSGLVAPTLYALRCLFGGKTLAYLHGLDLVVGSKIYQAIFMPCIRRLDHIVVNSQNTKRLALSKGIIEARITLINPGTNLPSLPSTREIALFRKQHNINFTRTMLFVGRLTQRKGLSKFIEKSLPTIMSSQPSVGLVVVGKDPKNSLNQLGEEQEVAALVARSTYRERIKFLGQLSDRDLALCYALSDVHIFPLIDVVGDVEGFGMVAIEAAALGTPTVAFDVGGVADAMSKKNGYLITAGDYPSFANAVSQALERGEPGTDSCREHASTYSWKHFDDNIKSTLMNCLS